MCRNSNFGKIRNKAIKSVFEPEDSRSRKENIRRPTGAHTWPRRAPTLGCAWRWCGHPVWPPDSSFGLKTPYNLKTPKIVGDDEKEFRSAATVPKPKIGIRSLRSGTLPDGELEEIITAITTNASPSTIHDATIHV